MTTLALFVVSAVALRGTGMDFFPEVDAGQMRLHVRAPTGSRIEATERVVARVEDAIRRVDTGAGSPGPSARTSGFPTFFNLAFVSERQRRRSGCRVARRASAGARADRAVPPRAAPRVGRRVPGNARLFPARRYREPDLEFRLARTPRGADQETGYGEVERAGPQAEGRASAIPGVVDVRVPQAFDHPGLLIDVNRERASQDQASRRLTSLPACSRPSARATSSAPSFWANPANGVTYSVAVQTRPGGHRFGRRTPRHGSHRCADSRPPPWARTRAWPRRCGGLLRSSRS